MSGPACRAASAPQAAAARRARRSDPPPPRPAPDSCDRAPGGCAASGRARRGPGTADEPGGRAPTSSWTWPGDRPARRGPGTLRFEGAGLPGRAPSKPDGAIRWSTLVVHDPRGAVRRSPPRFARAWRRVTSQAGGTPTTSPTSCASPTAWTSTLRHLMERACRGGSVRGLAGVKRLRTPSKCQDRDNNVAGLRPVQRLLRPSRPDPSMAYSCAYFTAGGHDPRSGPGGEIRQDRHPTGTRSRGPRDRRSGPGGVFAIHAARRDETRRATTTTNLEAQRSLAEKRVAEHGLADRASVLGADYRDLRRPLRRGRVD